MNKFFKVMGLALVASAPVFGAVRLKQDVANCMRMIQVSGDNHDALLYSDTDKSILGALRDAGMHVLRHGFQGPSMQDSTLKDIVQKHLFSTAADSQHFRVVAALTGRDDFNILACVRAFGCVDQNNDRGIYVRASCLGFPSARHTLSHGEIGIASCYEQAFFSRTAPTTSPEWQAYVDRAAVRFAGCIQMNPNAAGLRDQRIRDFLMGDTVSRYLGSVADAETGSVRSTTEATMLITLNF